MLAAGPVVAQEKVASASQISTAAEAVTLTNQVEDTVSEASSASEKRRVSSLGSEERLKLQRDDSKASRLVASSFNFDYNKNQISERAIDERILDRLGLFDSSDSSQSSRYNVELDLENEDSDWSFEVTVTVEF